jgi:uncharacterized membrane protein
VTGDRRHRPGPRLPIRALLLVVLAVIGCAISLVLAAFQLGVSRDVWDPLFGAGAKDVLTSPISRALPVPDALIGAAAYTLDALLGGALLFGFGRGSIVAGVLAVVAVMGAVVGIALAVAQPLVAHAGCTLCLCSTAVSVVLALGAVGEARDRWPSGIPISNLLDGMRAPAKEDHG